MHCTSQGQKELSGIGIENPIWTQGWHKSIIWRDSCGKSSICSNHFFHLFFPFPLLGMQLYMYFSNLNVTCSNHICLLFIKKPYIGYFFKNNFLFAIRYLRIFFNKSKTNISVISNIRYCALRRYMYRIPTDSFL